jgi:hypothetical protein
MMDAMNIVVGTKTFTSEWQTAWSSHMLHKSTIDFNQMELCNLWMRSLGNNLCGQEVRNNWILNYLLLKPNLACMIAKWIMLLQD